MVSSPFPQAIPTTNYNNAEEDNKVGAGRATMLKEPGSLSDDMEQNSPHQPGPWRLLHEREIHFFLLRHCICGAFWDSWAVFTFYLYRNIFWVSMFFSPSQAELKSKREDSSCC